MDRTVARMNIGRFRKLLAEERDSRKRETIRLFPRAGSLLVTTSQIGRNAHSRRRKWLRSAWFRLLHCTVNAV